MKNKNVLSITGQKPDAIALLKSNPDYPRIRGTVAFYQTKTGVIVISRVYGLPATNDVCKKPIFAMHIHSGGSCSGNEDDFFANAKTHYNPNNCPHPYHAGDMPPLFGVNGVAFSAFLTDRFSVKDIVGKTVVIHSNSDDFTTQPAGNSGEKIACGEIVK